MRTVLINSGSRTTGARCRGLFYMQIACTVHAVACACVAEEGACRALFRSRRGGGEEERAELGQNGRPLRPRAEPCCFACGRVLLRVSE